MMVWFIWLTYSKNFCLCKSRYLFTIEWLRAIVRRWLTGVETYHSRDGEGEREREREIWKKNNMETVNMLLLSALWIVCNISSRHASISIQPQTPQQLLYVKFSTFHLGIIIAQGTAHQKKKIHTSKIIIDTKRNEIIHCYIFQTRSTGEGEILYGGSAGIRWKKRAKWVEALVVGVLLVFYFARSGEYNSPWLSPGEYAISFIKIRFMNVLYVSVCVCLSHHSLCVSHCCVLRFHISKV